MSDAIIVAIVSGVFSLAGYLFGKYKSQSKTMYRIDQLEKKQDKHNTLIERMYNVEDRIHVLENKQAVADHRIKDLEDSKK